MRFVTFDEVSAGMRGRSVALVGSGPGVLGNEPGFIDSFDVVVRVSDYKTGDRAGLRCDVHYSFYGDSIKKSREALQRDGVELCVCKLPNSKPLKSEWHEVHGKPEGVDYRYIYRNRAQWWFCATFVPDDVRFLRKFELLDKHQPTTGFAAILDVLECEPAELYLTGYDFFRSGLRNVDEPWRHKNVGDPICHRPDLEAAWLVDNVERFRIRLDPTLSALVEYMAPA